MSYRSHAIERIPFLILAIKTNTFSQLKELPGLTIWCCRLAEAYALIIAVLEGLQLTLFSNVASAKYVSQTHTHAKSSRINENYIQ